MRRVSRIFWIILAIAFLIEAWLWSHIGPLIGRVVAWLPLRRIKAAVVSFAERLPPYAALAFFAVPWLLLVPLKFAEVAFLVSGNWIGAVLVIVLAKVIGVGLTAFLFDALQPKLMRISWFPRFYEVVMGWYHWAHGLIDPIKARLAARMYLFAPGRAGRTIRLLRRIRRRMHAAPAG